MLFHITVCVDVDETNIPTVGPIIAGTKCNRGPETTRDISAEIRCP